MKKRNVIIICAIAVAVTVVIAVSAIIYHTLKPGGIEAETVEEWPENKYTQEITPPSYGTPDYVLENKKNKSYAIFFKDITPEQSEEYIEQLKADGFEETNDVGDVIGRAFKKGDVLLSVSVSKDVMAIYIMK